MLIGPVKDDAALETLAPLKLRLLIFKRGAISDLRGLKRWPKLTDFGAILCNDIADLSPLAALPELTDVSFRDCAGLKKVDALLDLPKLKRLRCWGCRDNGALLKVLTKLRAKGVEVATELDA